MLELAFAAGQAATDFPQGVRPAQLAEEHGDELAPAGEAPRVPLGMVLVDGLLEFKTRKELQELGEDATKSLHGLASLESRFLEKSILPRCVRPCTGNYFF